MEVKNSNDELEIDLGEIITLLLSRIWIILFIGILGGLTMMIVSKFLLAPIYSTTTQVYVLNRQDQNSNSLTTADLQSGTQLSKDYVEIITSRTVLEEVIEELDLSDMEVSSLKNMISVSVPTDTRSIYITVSDTDAYRAQQIANKVREVAALRICDIMKVEAVNVVDEAYIPTAPSSPNILKNTLLGAVIGIILAIAVIIVKFIMDDTIKNADDVERYLGLSVLGSIPILGDDKKAKKQKQKEKEQEKKKVKVEIEDEPVYYEEQEDEDDDDLDYSDYDDDYSDDDDDDVDFNYSYDDEDE